jgi:hypothetical protein
MRDNVQSRGPEDYFRKSITVPFFGYTLNKMKTRITNLHARTALGLQLVPSIIENITPYLSSLLRQKSLWIRSCSDLRRVLKSVNR